MRAICGEGTEITETTDLSGKQIDDVDWVGLACDVEDALGIEIDYEKFMKCQTVGEIKAYVGPLVEAAAVNPPADKGEVPAPIAEPKEAEPKAVESKEAEPKA